MNKIFAIIDAAILGLGAYMVNNGNQQIAAEMEEEKGPKEGTKGAFCVGNEELQELPQTESALL